MSRKRKTPPEDGSISQKQEAYETGTTLFDPLILYHIGAEKANAHRLAKTCCSSRIHSVQLIVWSLGNIKSRLRSEAPEHSRDTGIIWLWRFSSPPDPAPKCSWGFYYILDMVPEWRRVPAFFRWGISRSDLCQALRKHFDFFKYWPSFWQIVLPIFPPHTLG